ncbi:MAG: Fur family transcriptional regulator [Bosea sp. (in: a-proteobacteria)]|nr:Fur family transcriptional regulator [Bosea sp. (in: a-proteobacteria)]
MVHGDHGAALPEAFPDKLSTSALAQCAATGRALTTLRREVLAIFAGAPRPLKAYEIVERLSTPSRRVSPISVYRSLDFLIEIGIVHRLATQNAFVARDRDRAQDETLVFMICQCCGDVDEAVLPGMTRSLAATADAHGFRSRGHSIELQGECEDCRSALANPNRRG